MFWIGMIVGIVIGFALTVGAAVLLYMIILKCFDVTHDEWSEACGVLVEASMNRECRVVAIDEDGDLLAEYTFEDYGE